MNSKKHSSYHKEKIVLKQEDTSDIYENFDWDWIFDREWSRAKK